MYRKGTPTAIPWYQINTPSLPCTEIHFRIFEWYYHPLGQLVLYTKRGILSTLFFTDTICSNGWTHFRGTCFVLETMNSFLTWTTAEDECKSMGGDLASVRDEHDMGLIHALLTQNAVEKDTTTFIGT